MLTFDQQTYSDNEKGTHGDCTRAMVYTLAGKDLNLPHPIKDMKTWNMEFFEQLEEIHKLELNFYPREKDFWPRFVGRCGISPRGVRHVVVWDRENNEMAHDPHPSRHGLMQGTEDGWYVLNEVP